MSSAKPNETERQLRDEWERLGVYHWDDSASREDMFVIDTPPPTVSGLLHMGHVFSYVQADFVARYRRMRGQTVFYPMGFDDNGLPTERLVEKVKKIRAHAMERSSFVKVCEEVSAEARVAFRELFCSLALSVDWRQEYHTISVESRRISQLSFLDLADKGLAERRLQPMFWDCVDRTAVAQAEAEDKELPSRFSDIAFRVDETGEEVLIGTTRPELLAACGAVFFHPEDPRYVALAGKHAVTPLFGVRVPFLADDAVKIDKGTGLVMCCTFGDETDMMWRRKHDLPLRVVIGRDGKLHGLASVVGEACGKETAADSVCSAAVAALDGLKIEEARAKTLELLAEAGVLRKSDPITHSVRCAERSGAPLEIIPTEQWFIRLLDSKEQLKAKAAACEWRPAFMKLRVDQWIDGLSWDWCISRQRYYGVPFPVWYSKRPGEEGKILYASRDQLPVDPLTDLPEGYAREEVTPDPDVMDTWATSSITPQINASGIDEKTARDPERFRKLYPADLRPQAHEIIRTWAFYTLAKSHLHADSVPWKTLMISGWCLAADKTKMSKSKGNVVTPVDLIAEKGADAVRYWASGSRLGADTAYSEDAIKMGAKLVNKIRNACKFVQPFLVKHADPLAPELAVTETTDRWMLAELKRAAEGMSSALEEYEYCEARVLADDFFWKVFCDNYLEYVKVRAYGEHPGVTPEGRESARAALTLAADVILRLYAPYLPYAADEMYGQLFPEAKAKAGGSVHARGQWPDVSAFPEGERIIQAGRALVKVMDSVRKLKAGRNVSVKWPLDALFVAGEAASYLDSSALRDLAFAANAKQLMVIGAGTEIPDVAAREGDIAVVFAAAESDAA